MEAGDRDRSRDPSSTAGEGSDSEIERKRAQMIERLSNLHQARVQSSAREKSDSAPPSESTEAFLARFSDSKREIETRIADSKTVTDAESVKSRLEQIAKSIEEMEKLVAENSYFLPSYEVRSALRSVAELRQGLEVLNSELVPKKKFSFKSKSVKKGLSLSRPVAAEGTDSEPDTAEKGRFKARESPGFRSRTGEVLVKDFKGLEVGEFTISDLEECEVRLIGRVRAIYVHRLRNCKVYAGPVLGSILIEDVEDCVFVLASHQIRIHHAKKCDFYLRVRSRPIIEDCGGVRFGPYCLEYEGIDGDLKESRLDEETGNWGNVDDFKWLRAVQSPNWSVVPEKERVGTVIIDNKMSG
uniref:C-CAP/cofactor C-like domain-containing protein n=1 Tax=Kalanchoe fedtschenkoi TaxID=63787 RepID=A0A7N0T6I6_KALFE